MCHFIYIYIYVCTKCMYVYIYIWRPIKAEAPTVKCYLCFVFLDFYSSPYLALGAGRVHLYLIQNGLMIDIPITENGEHLTLLYSPTSENVHELVIGIGQLGAINTYKSSIIRTLWIQFKNVYCNFFEKKIKFSVTTFHFK